MAKVLRPITACLKKTEAMEDNCASDINSTQPENDKAESPNSETQPGLIWRVSSGLYTIGSGAVGLGVGSVKWAASATYNVGSGVVSTAQNVVSKVSITAKPKPKKE